VCAEKRDAHATLKFEDLTFLLHTEGEWELFSKILLLKMKKLGYLPHTSLQPQVSPTHNLLKTSTPTPWTLNYCESMRLSQNVYIKRSSKNVCVLKVFSCLAFRVSLNVPIDDDANLFTVSQFNNLMQNTRCEINC
jgi:hypothetical protein